jgi:hypothetical protein
MYDAGPRANLEQLALQNAPVWKFIRQENEISAQHRKN